MNENVDIKAEEVTADVPIDTEVKPALRVTGVRVKPKADTCPCCNSAARSIEAGAFECLKCGTVFQTAAQPTLNGKSFKELFDGAKPKEQFVFPASELRCERSLAQLKDQKVTSVFSNSGIVAALVREGFHVLTHVPSVVFVKP